MIGLILLKIFVIGKIISFKLIVEEHPLKKGKDTFNIRKGKYLYLNEDNDIFSISNKRTTKSIARLVVLNALLRMFITKKDRFPYAKDIQKNILGSTIIIQTETGEKCHVKFISSKTVHSKP